MAGLVVVMMQRLMQNRTGGKYQKRQHLQHKKGGQHGFCIAAKTRTGSAFRV